MDDTVSVLLRCRHCGHRETVDVPMSALMKWDSGEATIQRALPMLSADQRELLMTGTCGACFDKLMEKLK